MKPFLALVFLLVSCNLSAQSFNRQIYYEYGKGDYPHTGNIVSINDTLAYIRFVGTSITENAYFPCTYLFRNDTLYMTELDSSLDLNKKVEYSSSIKSRNWAEDGVVFLGYQIYYESGGQAIYDSLVFQIGEKKFPNTKQCNSHCAVIPRPTETEFEIKVWNKSTLLDSYFINLEQENDIIRMTKDIFSSNLFYFYDSFEDTIEKKIPPSVSIDGKEYALVVKFLDRSAGFALPITE